MYSVEDRATIDALRLKGAANLTPEDCRTFIEIVRRHRGIVAAATEAKIAKPKREPKPKAAKPAKPKPITGAELLELFTGPGDTGAYTYPTQPENDHE